MIVTESDYQEYDKYPIEIINYIGYETSERFNDNKNEYIGKSIYYDIILKENLTTACGNPRCLICYEKDYECISLKSEEESEVLTTKEKYKDLEILYTTIIIAGASIIPFFYFYSFQNLRIFFFIIQIIIFCIITFNSKYNKNYLWNDTNFEPIKKTPYPIIVDIDYLYDDYLKVSYSYQNYSIIKTDEFSKECLLFYFVKKSDICPITYIEVDLNNNLTDYININFGQKYFIHYKRNYKYGQLYKDNTIKYFNSTIWMPY